MKALKLAALSIAQVVVVCMTLGTSTTYAAGPGCNANTCTGSIDRVFFTGGGELWIRLTDVDIKNAGADNCTTGQNYGVVATTNQRLKEFYAMTLTMMALDKTMSLRFLDNSTNCEIQYVYTDN